MNMQTEKRKEIKRRREIKHNDEGEILEWISTIFINFTLKILISLCPNEKGEGLTVPLIDYLCKETVV